MQILIHRHEQARPSSTGRLVARVVNGAVCHVYQRLSRFFPATGYPTDTLTPERELWVLHPSGDPLPNAVASAGESTPKRWPTVLLLDGTWRQAGEMLASVRGRGRCVRLPDSATSEPSRFWLRTQSTPAQLCSAEAVIGVLGSMGDHEAEHRLRLHFELHVYATLLSRGHRELAERYLGHSPLLTEPTHAIDRLHTRRGGLA